LGAKLTALILVVFLGSGCARAPVQEMSDARQALDAAEAAAVGGEPPEELVQGRELLHGAEESLDRGEYEQARELALEARRAAVTARESSLAEY